MDFVLEVKKLHTDAKIPVRSTDYAAAYDLYALEDGIIDARSKSIIRTGIAIRIPILKDYMLYGSIRSRSGLSAKFNLETGAGVIDYDYSDEVRVILYNHGNEAYSYKKHDRIAQLILEMIATPSVKEVEELSKVVSNRNGGFGSTGQ